MNNRHSATTPASGAKSTSSTYLWLVFALLIGLMMSNYLSRQVVTVLFPFLKADWSLSDTQLGSLVSMAALTAGLFSLPISLLVDRYGRVLGVTLMAVLWGLATLLCALAGNYLLLLAAHVLLGVAQAAFGGAGGAILLGLFPARQHSTVMGSFLAAALVGSVFSIVLGGILATHYGWRMAFSVFGVVALLMALLFRLVAREPQAAASGTAGAVSAEKLPLRQAFGALFAAPTAVYVYLGCGLQMFTVGASLAWVPSYLNRYHGLQPADAGVKAGIFVLVSAVGMTLGGALVDRLARQAPARKLRITAIYTGLTMLLFVGAFAIAPGTLQLWLIGLGMLVSGAHSGPSTAIVTEVNDPRLRATVLAVVALAVSLLGMAPGPFVTGLIADHSDLNTAMLLMPVASLLAGLCFLAANRHYAKDALRFQAPAESSIAALEEEFLQVELHGDSDKSDKPGL
ncbi:MFS transporter [Pseudomonas sp. N040]|uniref:MFS transporter n=1 Tax=Pseudomonas sp. N040 TaxID=2785325 RepID=UPI0018A26C9D|nr:MFS transporter [Pseudomonas sp. N040]MBF7731573.1 MFS transporter [Pseudomonas sp. N040]MBW7015217.1 MFS transporter [Pseudomonas sp. N040]